MQPLPLDLHLFDLLNFDGGVVLDRIMWFFSEKIVWAPLYIFLLWHIGHRYGWRYALVILLAAVAVAAFISVWLAMGFRKRFCE